MPAGAVGTSWAVGSWLDTVYEADTWQDSDGTTPHAEVVVRVRGHNSGDPDAAYDVLDGGLWVKDPSDLVYISFDWNAVQLAPLVTIADYEFRIEALDVDDGSPAAALTASDESLLSGSRKVQAGFSGGTLGALYRVDCTITTSEGQIKERSILIRIEQK